MRRAAAVHAAGGGRAVSSIGAAIDGPGTNVVDP
jgi:hypothetical protein